MDSPSRVDPSVDTADFSTPSDVSLALFLLLPVVLLGWPGELGLLHGVFAATELTATGIAVLAALPAALIVIFRRADLPATRMARLALAGLGLTLVWALARPLFGAGSDPSESARAISAFALIAAFFIGGTSLGGPGRAVFVWGACAVTCLLLVPPLWADMEGLSGALGNSGELSGAALPGALVGVFAALRPKKSALQRFAFLLAPALFVLHAALAPSYVGALAFAGVLAAGTWAAFRSGSKLQGRALALGACCTLACVVAFAFVRRSSAVDTSFQSSNETETHSTSPDLGGFAVRKMIWQSSLSMSAARPLLGYGPGQFSVHFPPYRNVREIEASSYGRAAGVETEVEHPHQDVLVVATELGLIGLAGWLCFLGAAVLGGLCVLRRQGLEAALAAGGLGVILHAMANATLTSNPAAATLGAACLGAGLQVGREARRQRGLVLPIAAAVLLLWLAPESWSAVRHGRAIARLASGDPSASTQIDAWEDALDAVPESSVALSARARLAEALKQSPESIEKLWRKVNAVRPHRVEALIQLGVGRGRAGDLQQASEFFGHAHELDAAHPVAAQNQARVLFLLGRSVEGEALLEELESFGRPAEESWLKRLALDVLGRCDVEAATALYERAEAADELRDLRSGDFAWARSGKLRKEERDKEADAWGAHAHRLWGSEHLAAGRASDAVRSYRQAVRIARDAVPPDGPPALLREYAAALIEAGRGDEAQRVLDQM